MTRIRILCQLLTGLNLLTVQACSPPAGPTAKSVASEANNLIFSNSTDEQVAGLLRLNQSRPDGLLVRRLAELSRSTNDTVATMAIINLGVFGKMALDALPTLAGIVCDRSANAQRRTVALAAISKIDVNSDAMLRSISCTMTSSIPELHKHGLICLFSSENSSRTNLLEATIDLFPTETAELQLVIIHGVAKMGDSSNTATKFIEQQLHSNLATHRNEAIRALTLNGRSTDAHIIQFGRLLSDPDRAVQLSALTSLHQIGIRAVIVAEDLRRFADSTTDNSVKALCVRILERIERSR